MRRQPAFAAAIAEERPIADLNMTPLIDVLLVLIVMFILLVPTMTHEVPIDLPQGPTPTVAATPHRLVVARNGATVLDGVAMDDAALAARLPVVVGGEGVLTLAVDPRTRYERADQVLAVIKRAGVTKLGFEGLGGAQR